MTSDLTKLIERSRSITMTGEQMEKQRRSFAYGSAKIENDDITREMIDDAAEKIGMAAGNGR